MWQESGLAPSKLDVAWINIKVHMVLLPDIELFAAAAKSLQSCPTLCDPIDGSPLGSPVPGILQARTPEWVAISFSRELFSYPQITKALFSYSFLLSGGLESGNQAREGTRRERERPRFLSVDTEQQKKKTGLLVVAKLPLCIFPDPQYNWRTCQFT